MGLEWGYESAASHIMCSQFFRWNLLEKYYFQMGDEGKPLWSSQTFWQVFLWRDVRKWKLEISYSTCWPTSFRTKLCSLEVSSIFDYFYLKRRKDKYTIADLKAFRILLDFVDPVLWSLYRSVNIIEIWISCWSKFLCKVLSVTKCDIWRTKDFCY